MITINGLDHIGIRVSDFKRSIAFYRRFGFDVIREDFIERVIVLRHVSGTVLNLLDFVDPSAKERNVLMDNEVKYAGYTHIALRVIDILHVMNYLTVLEILITEGPVVFGDGKTSIFIRDPDRNVIEFTQLPLGHKTRQEVTK